MNESIAPNEYIVPTKSTSPGRRRQDRDEAGEDDERSHGVLKLRVEPAQRLGELPVAGHRVRDPGCADDPAFVAMKRIVAASTPT